MCTALFLLALWSIFPGQAIRVMAASSLQVGGSATAQGYDPSTYLPINQTQSFTASDNIVVSWVQFVNIYSPSHMINFVWRTPQGFVYWKPNATIPDPGAGKYYGSWNIIWYIPVKGYTPSLIPGTWHIDVYADGVYAAGQDFTMTSQVTSSQTWVNLGPKNIATDLYGKCHATSYSLPCPVGVASGKVAAFAYDSSTPTVLYLSCDGGASSGGWCTGGIFKSTDSGTTWHAVNNGFTGSSARGISVMKGNPDVVVALTDFAVFKTTDGAKSWKQTYNGAGFFGGELYRTDDNSLYVATKNSILKSTDFGSTWTAVSVFSMSQDEEVRAIAVVSGGRTIFAEMYIGNRLGEILKSTDGGATYSASNTFVFGLPSEPHGGEIVVNPADSSIVWTIAFYDYYSSSLLVSRDGGSTFSIVDPSAIGTPTRGYIAAQYLCYDPLAPSTMYLAGDGWLYKSINGGNSFSVLSNSSAPITADFRLVQVDQLNHNTLYATSDQGVYRSSDGGIHWTDLNAERSSTHVYSVAAEGTRIYTVVQDFAEIYSCDSGSTWTNSLSSSCLTFGSNPFFYEWGTVAINPYDKSNVIFYVISASEGHVLVSRDGGNTFTTSQFVTRNPAIAPSYPTSLIAFNSKNPNIVYLGGSEGVYQSRDYGASWQLLVGSPGSALVADAVQNAHVLYASNSRGLYKSLDDGATWYLTNDLSILSTRGSPNTFRSLAVDPLSDSVVAGVVLYNSSVAISMDGGQTFRLDRPSSNPYGLIGVFYLSVSGAPVMVLTGQLGIFVSFDLGAHWKDYTLNLPQPYPDASSFYLSSDGTAYVSTWGSGVWAYKNFLNITTTTTSTTTSTTTTSTVITTTSTTTRTTATSTAATTTSTTSTATPSTTSSSATSTSTSTTSTMTTATTTSSSTASTQTATAPATTPAITTFESTTSANPAGGASPVTGLAAIIVPIITVVGLVALVASLLRSRRHKTRRPEAGGRAGSAFSFCRSCGAPVRGSNAFCEQCGEKLR